MTSRTALGHRACMSNCLSLHRMSGDHRGKYMAMRRRHRRRAGRLLCATHRRPWRLWICSYSRRSRFGCCMISDLQHSRHKLVWRGVTARPSAIGWPSTDRSLRLAKGATIYRSRSDCRVLRCRHLVAFAQWATGSADRATVRHAINWYSERLIVSIRRECLDHVVVFGERTSPPSCSIPYQKYYNEARTHLALHK